MPYKGHWFDWYRPCPTCQFDLGRGTRTHPCFVAWPGVRAMWRESWKKPYPPVLLEEKRRHWTAEDGKPRERILGAGRLTPTPTR